MRRTRRVLSFYARIGRTCLSHGPPLILLAVAVFVPLGLLDALAATVDLDALRVDNGFKVAALLAAISAVLATSLLGEVFYSGAAAISLTSPEGEPAPSLREIAGRLRWGRLIAIDLIYVALVIVGIALFIVPGVIVFIYFGLSGPVVEIEHRGVRAALARSYDLVRGNFWFVFWILAPIEVVGDGLNEAIASGIHHLLGDALPAAWLAESTANIVTTPVVAIAAVLLTLNLIEAKDGAPPATERPPTPAPA